MALGLKYQHKDCHVYALTGDGELQEGIVWEAAMAAAHYKLDNLTLIVDRNGLQIDGTTEDVMALGDLAAKFRAFGFYVKTSLCVLLRRRSKARACPLWKIRSAGTARSLRESS